MINKANSPNLQKNFVSTVGICLVSGSESVLFHKVSPVSSISCPFSNSQSYSKKWI